MGPPFLAELGRRNRHNLRTLRQSPAAEISGALGDLGTLLPLMIALALQGSIDLGATLVFSGVFNIVTGVVFGIPLPVQPMKAIAASALATHMTLPVTTAAGAFVSLAVLLLSATGLLRLLTRLVPVPITKGIQLGAALRLIASGADLILPLPWLPAQHPPFDSRLIALLLFLALLAVQRPPLSTRIPYALIVFLLGLLASLFFPSPPSPPSSPSSPSSPPRPFLSPYHPHLSHPEFTSPVALSSAISQLPLTTLNSILAVSALAADLLPNIVGPAPSTTALGVSVAAMNLLGCWWGAMPVCHGAGGLAAQHAFGARSGASVVLLGVGKVVLGVLFGGSSSGVSSLSTIATVGGGGSGGGSTGGLLGLLQGFPRGVLGVMVIAAGLELGRVGAGLNSGAADLWEESVGAEETEDGMVVRRQRWCREVGVAEQQARWMVMMVTAAGILAFKNDAVGFVAGCCCHAAYRLTDWAEERRGAAGERTPLLREGTSSTV